MYDGCARNAYHLYMLRYDPAGFDGLPRSKFLKAPWRTRGSPAPAATARSTREPFLEAPMDRGRSDASIAPADRRLSRADPAAQANDRLCEQGVWLFQTLFLGPRSDMDQIADAFRKVQKQAGKLLKA